MRIKQLAFIAIAFLFMSSGFLAWSKFVVVSSTPTEKSRSAAADEPPPFDQALLARFVKFTEQLDLSKNDLLLVGKLNVVDGADSTGKISNAPYIFSKRGKEFYFRLGNMETVNAKGMYIFVDHELKKIMVSAQREVMPSLPVPNAAQLLKSLKGEGYTLTTKVGGDIEHFSFNNDLHLSCKEYTLSINKGTDQLCGMRVRMSNVIDTEDPKKDKVMELSLSKVSNDPALDDFINKQFVKVEGNKLKLGEAFQQYELIIK
jgi:hypothetical protein